MQSQIIHEGFFLPDREKTYVHVPFDIPEGTVRLDVSYTYSNEISAAPQASGGNTIDLGVFDARGIEFQSPGFRGWSGSERHSFFITEVDATPGYLPGRLIPGCWHVSLGLYKIAPTGCTYRLTITVTHESGRRPIRPLPAPVQRLPASSPLARSGRWLGGELHCHSWHSDGQVSPEQLVALARERGLDFLALSDHNTTSGQRDLLGLHEPGLILIPALEVTTFKGHFNVWGSGRWFDYRVQTPQQMAAALNEARDSGGLTSCNHPKPFGPMWEFGDVDNFDCIEVWNGPWFAFNQASLAFWLERIKQGRRIPAVAGSDWHRMVEMDVPAPRAPGKPVTWVYVCGEPSVGSILAGLRAGHATLSDSVDGPHIELRAGAASALAGDQTARPAGRDLPVHIRCQRGGGHRLLLLDEERTLFDASLSGSDETIDIQAPVAGSRFVRAEVRDSSGNMLAMSNPVYLI